MSPVEILAECVNGGVEEGSSLPAPALIVSTGVIGILFSMYVAFFQTCPVMHVPHSHRLHFCSQLAAAERLVGPAGRHLRPRLW